MSNPVLDAIQNRHCKRAFLDTPVDINDIKEILSAATNAASSKNTQPWGVEVLSGDTLKKLTTIMCEKFDNNDLETPDYTYSTEPISDTFKERARACGYALFKLKGIDKDDREKRLAHNRENFTFFDAPLAMIIHVHKDAERGNFLDMGLFLQNIMLGLVSKGMGSCPQYSITQLSDTIRDTIGLSKDRWIVCGLAVGYPDPDAIVNTFIPERVKII